MREQDNPWRAFFDGYAPEYHKACFAQDTVPEVDFLMDVVGFTPGMRVLDMGCGAGRHAIELARRGFTVTGVDLSEGMLAEAAKSAAAAGVTVQWVHEDATRFCSPPAFDAAICLCEGAFGLLGAGQGANDQPLAILRAIYGALVPGGVFVLTCLNAMHFIRAATPEDLARGAFDPTSLVETSAVDWDTAAGKGTVTVRERSFVPTELEALCRWAGLEVKHVWGGTAGRWGRRPVELDEMEIMVVARKPAEERARTGGSARPDAIEV